MLDVSIVILNYNGEPFIAKTLQSISSLDYPIDKYEIIIVDNASTDKSREIINSFCHPEFISGSESKQMLKQVQYDKIIDNQRIVIPAKAGIQTKITTIFLPKNIGFSGGNNVGIKVAEGKYIALLNNDCTVDKNWLKELVGVAEKDEKIFAVNSKIYLGNTNKIQNAGIRIFPNGYAQDIGAVPKNNIQYYEEDHGQYNKEREIDAACGAAALYRKSILEKIGPLDESFFLYYEDVEISERAKKQGYRLVYAPGAVVHHLHAVSSGEWSPFFIYHSEKGRLLHMFLHFPLCVFLREYIIFSIKAKLRFLVRLFTYPSSTQTNWQYVKVKYYFLFNFPILFWKKYSPLIR